MNGTSQCSKHREMCTFLTGKIQVFQNTALRPSYVESMLVTNTEMKGTAASTSYIYMKHAFILEQNSEHDSCHS